MRCSAAWYWVGGAALGTGTPLLAALTGRGPLELEETGLLETGLPETELPETELLETGLPETELADREMALSFPIDYPWRKLKRTKSDSKCGGSSSA